MIHVLLPLLLVTIVGCEWTYADESVSHSSMKRGREGLRSIPSKDVAWRVLSPERGEWTDLKLEALPGEMYFVLEDLRFDTSYEIVVSYPATMPTSYELHVEEGRESHVSARRGVGSFRRKLLNTEKLVIEPYSRTQHEDVQLYLHLYATVDGVMRRSAETTATRFNIRIEALYFGLAFRVWKLIGVGVPIILLTLVYAAPWFEKKIEDALATEESESKSI